MTARGARLRAALTRPLSTRGAIVIVCVAGILAAALIMVQSRGLTFFYENGTSFRTGVRGTQTPFCCPTTST